MRLIGWLRLRLGFCRMGDYGCWRRPDGVWHIDIAIPLCQQHWDELDEEFQEFGGPVGTWEPKPKNRLVWW